MSKKSLDRAQAMWSGRGRVHVIGLGERGRSTCCHNCGRGGGRFVSLELGGYRDGGLRPALRLCYYCTLRISERVMSMLASHFPEAKP